MKHPTIFLAVLIAAGALAGVADASPKAFTGHELAPQAKVSLVQARAIATKARPGMITDQELEREAGGSGLRYSFDVRSRGKTYEVGVDAATGAVLENGAEGKNPD